MSKNVMVPLSLFERIIELTDDLRDSSYGYCLCTKYGDVLKGLAVKMQKLELQNAYTRMISAQNWEVRLRARLEYRRQRRQLGMIDETTCDGLKAYESKIGDMTEPERDELRKWVADGNSPYGNPCLLYGENGHILDFITAIRIDEDMMRNPEDYFSASDLERYSDHEGDELPFRMV